jgi:hypothetical protein
MLRESVLVVIDLMWHECDDFGVWLGDLNLEAADYEEHEHMQIERGV